MPEDTGVTVQHPNDVNDPTVVGWIVVCANGFVPDLYTSASRTLFPTCEAAIKYAKAVNPNRRPTVRSLRKENAEPPQPPMPTEKPGADIAGWAVAYLDVLDMNPKVVNQLFPTETAAHDYARKMFPRTRPTIHPIPTRSPEPPQPLKYGDKVKVVRGHEGGVLDEGDVREVAIVIRAGSKINSYSPHQTNEHQVEQDQVVLKGKEGETWPYAWDTDRFEKVN